MRYTLRHYHFLLWDYVVHVYEEAHIHKLEVGSVDRVKQQWFSSNAGIYHLQDYFIGDIRNDCFLCYAFLSENCEGCPLYEKFSDKTEFCSYYHKLYSLSVRSPCPYDKVIEMAKQIRDCWR